MENRRKFPRFESSLQVKYHPSTDNAQFGYSILSDVSRGGIRMPALSNIAPDGGLIRMDIKKGDGKGNIPVVGRIRWSKMFKREAPLDKEIGIEFVDIAPDDIDRLIRVR
jgi:hypothetical protein